MKKRQLIKAAYQSIVKNGKSHQETFDELKIVSQIDQESLAQEISKIPSAYKQEKFKNLRYLYVGMLILVIITRVFGVISLFQITNINGSLILLGVVVGGLLPAVGIWGSMTSRASLYQTIALLSLISIIRSLNTLINSDPLSFAFLIPFIGAIILGFYIPTKLKTSYTKKGSEYVFESNKLSSLDESLLDTEV